MGRYRNDDARSSGPDHPSAKVLLGLCGGYLIVRVGLGLLLGG